MKILFSLLLSFFLFVPVLPTQASPSDTFNFLTEVAEEGGAEYTDVTGGEDLYKKKKKIIK